MDISVRTESWQVEDRSWLLSRDGTKYTQTITLDIAAFTANTHYPNGYIPSGILLGQIASSSLWGPYAGNASEIQTVTVTGTPTGGTFTLTFDGQTTAAIAYNAAAATVQAALEAMSNIQPNDAVVTGSAGGPYTVTFGANKLGTNVPQMTASGASLTGGTSPSVTVATGTGGGSTSATGLQTPVGFLFNSTQVKAPVPTPLHLGAPLLYRGSIRTAKLPTGHGLDAAARAALTKFYFA
jgi:hypothetical protein